MNLTQINSRAIWYISKLHLFCKINRSRSVGLSSSNIYLLNFFKMQVTSSLKMTTTLYGWVTLLWTNHTWKQFLLCSQTHTQHHVAIMFYIIIAWDTNSYQLLLTVRKNSQRFLTSLFFFLILQLSSLENKKYDKCNPKESSPGQWLLDHPENASLATQRAMFWFKLVQTVARRAKSLREFLALSTAWNH